MHDYEINDDGAMWVFGYGSLLWKPDFDYDEQVVGYVKGFKRRFWLLNTTHRGVPEKPGRVVTLVEDPEQLVWGVAYKISQESVHSACQKLACRERDYVTTSLTFHPREDDKTAFNITLYIASPEHSNFGEADDIEIAKVIHNSIGPSGKNTEYLFKLAEYVRKNIPEDQDSHLFELESLVKQVRCTDSCCVS